nr:glutathione transferase GstA [uncultured Duganella sp.]
MKLYYSPGTCSMAAHIVLREAAARYELAKVDLRQHKTEAGEDFYAINSKGSVPALALDDGAVLTEGAAILQYLGDHYAPALVPANGTLARARLQEMLNYLASEYHKSFVPLFYLPKGDDGAALKAKVAAKQAYLNELLGDGREFILGGGFGVADSYLYTVTRWSANFGISLDALPALKAYMARIEARPAVQATLLAEGQIT